MSAECWHCHVPLEPRRPHRAEYDSEPAFLIAAATWLDYTFPARVAHRDRIAAWARLDIESDPERLRARLVELIEQDAPFTDADREEFDRLVAAWRLHQTPDTTRKARP